MRSAALEMKAFLSIGRGLHSARYAGAQGRGNGASSRIRWPAFTLTRDVAARQVLGTDVGIDINADDECHTEPNFQDRYGR